MAGASLACGSMLLGALLPVKREETPSTSSKEAKTTNDKEPEFPSMDKMPVEMAQLTAAPNVPPPIRRQHPVKLIVQLDSDVALLPLTKGLIYRGWAFNRIVPGPFIRARVGDVMEVQFTNRDVDGMAHNLDFHAVIGPGGGSPVTFAEKDETRVARFRLLYPGLFVYHCAAAPIPMHIGNGMYGLVLVEPADGMPPVDREFYVMQSEFYTQPSMDTEQPNHNRLEYAYVEALNENAQVVVFNGRDGALTERPLMAKTGETVRIFFGNAGPNLASAFHVIGSIFERVYRDGTLLDAPARGIQTTLVPPGGATIAELYARVPGTYTLIDHAIDRIDKGAIGYLKVSGAPRDDIYVGNTQPTPCPGCKLHE